MQSPLKRILIPAVAFSAAMQISVPGAIAADPSDTAPFVSKIAADRREFEIVRTEFSPNRSAATVTLASATGIFAFNLDLAAAKLSKLTFVVQKQKFCEGLTFHGKDARETDLRSTKGVTVSQVADDIVIEFTAIALDALKPGGRVQYINQYR